jgi:hypothetical protein
MTRKITVTPPTRITLAFFVISYFGCFIALALENWISEQSVNWQDNFIWSLLFSSLVEGSYIVAHLTGLFDPLASQNTFKQNLIITLKRVAVLLTIAIVGMLLMLIVTLLGAKLIIDIHHW